MSSKTDEVKQIASELLAAMLSNPHIYSTVSDDGINGQREQTLIIMAIEMAETLVKKVDSQTF